VVGGRFASPDEARGGMLLGKAEAVVEQTECFLAVGRRTSSSS
jgi:hypothetical protein